MSPRPAGRARCWPGPRPAWTPVFDADRTAWRWCRAWTLVTLDSDAARFSTQRPEGRHRDILYDSSAAADIESSRARAMGETTAGGDLRLHRRSIEIHLYRGTSGWRRSVLPGRDAQGRARGAATPRSPTTRRCCAGSTHADGRPAGGTSATGRSCEEEHRRDEERWLAAMPDALPTAVGSRAGCDPPASRSCRSRPAWSAALEQQVPGSRGAGGRAPRVVRLGPVGNERRSRVRGDRREAAACEMPTRRPGGGDRGERPKRTGAGGRGSAGLSAELSHGGGRSRSTCRRTSRGCLREHVLGARTRRSARARSRARWRRDERRLPAVVRGVARLHRHERPAAGRATRRRPTSASPRPPRGPSVDSTTRARRCTGASTGRRPLQLDRVVGGDRARRRRRAPACVIRWCAAVQLLWQSSSAPMMPPLSMPGNASWCGSGVQSATTSSPSTKLRMRRPLLVGGAAAEADALRARSAPGGGLVDRRSVELDARGCRPRCP